MRLLLVEDDDQVAETVTAGLTAAGFLVERAREGREAWFLGDTEPYAAAILDLGLPGLDGLSVLRQWRAAGQRLPVLILSARGDWTERVEGIEAGADDYLPKPFHLAELNARIKSVIRRQRRDGEMDIRLANIRIVPDTFQVFVDDKEIELNRKEYDILLYFANRPGRLVNKNTLAESVWGDHIDQVDNFDFIYAQIKNLRKKLKDAGALAELKAVYGFGYKMTVE